MAWLFYIKYKKYVKHNLDVTMKPIISLITGISIITLIGCNNVDRENERVGSKAVLSDFDTTETATEMDTVGSTASDQSSQAEQSEGDTTYTETEVVQIDTVATEVVYDVNRRTIEQIDTVGATATHKVERKVIKRTVVVDTLTETVDKEQEVAYEEGNYKVVDEQVEQDTVTEIINHPAPASDESDIQVNNNQPLEDEEADTAQEITTEQNQNTTNNEQDTTTIESRVPNQSAEQDTTEETTGGTSN